jgi:CubicO group peptidase (beta-lactamase class C family)
MPSFRPTSLGCAGILLTVLGALVGPRAVHAQARPLDAAVARDLDLFITRGMRAWDIPGLSIAVVHADSIVLVRGYGVRRLGAPAEVDTQTLFGLMSTTKAFTALAIALLVDDGRLRWSDPVTRWVPEFQMPAPFVTHDLKVLDLLTHNTGLGNADLLWVRGDYDAAEIFRRVRFLRPEYPLRGGFVYQNVMYGLAGEVVARASGMPYGEFLRRRIFNPLGMNRTLSSLAAVRASGDANISAAHFRIRDTIRVIPEESVDPIPSAGALWSDAADMALWLRFLLDSGVVAGRRLVSDSGFRMLFAPHAIIGADEFYPTAELTRPHWTTYGLGWFQQDYRGHFIAFHTGSLDGRTAIVGLLPDLQVGVYLFGNLDHAEFRHAVMLKTLDLYLGGPPRDWSADLLDLYGRRRGRAEGSPAEGETAPAPGPTLPLARYAGTYVHPIWGDLVVELSGDSLLCHLGISAELRGSLRPWRYDTFRAMLGDGRSPPQQVRFSLDADGQATELRLPGLDEIPFRRAP